MPETHRPIYAVFDEIARRFPDKTALLFKRGETFQKWTYHELHGQIKKVGVFLKKQNVREGDKVALLLENQPEFVWSFLGVMSIGAVAVPLDVQYGPEQVAKLTAHAEAKILLTSSKRIPELNLVLQNIATFAVDTIIFDGKGEDITADLPPISPQALAALFYTSGTTDQPKAVMLTHANLLANIASIHKLKIITPLDVFISLLPLHHTYAFTTTMLLPLMSSAAMAYPKSLSSNDILECLVATKTTIFVGVPQLFILLHRSIQDKIRHLPFLKRAMVHLVGKCCFAVRKTTGLNFAKVFFHEIHQRFGMKLRLMVSGGARLDPLVEENFYRWGFTLLEGYGLTETSPVVTFMTPDTIQFGSVGQALPDVDIKIVEPDAQGRGEVVLRGPNVMQGYYRMEEETAKVLRDKWFYSGDIGYLDGKNNLFLTGRKKELIILPNGENLNPEEIEAHYLQSAFIKEIAVLEHRHHLVAVVVADEEYFHEKKISDLRGKLKWDLENFSVRLPTHQRIRGFVIAKEPLPRTRLGKVQRYQLSQIYTKLDEQNTEHASADQPPENFESAFTQRALAYFSQKFDRPVHLKDHLELDLGMDSLGRIEILMGLQKELGLQMTEEQTVEFFMCGTIEDLMNKVKVFFPGLMLSAVSGSASDAIVRQGLNALSEIVKKDVKPTDHLELDLGLDSLGRVEVLLNLQEKLGLPMDDAQAMEFFLCETVGQLMEKLQRIVPNASLPLAEKTISWTDVLRLDPDEATIKKINIKPADIGTILFNVGAVLILKTFFKLFYRLEVHGKENLSDEGPYLICPNHTTFFDGPIIFAALPFKILLNTFFLGDSRFLEHPLLRPCLRISRLLPIEFSYNMVAALRACAYVLRHKKIICYFPEGHRAIDNNLDDFKKGVGILIKEMNISAIPTYINGAYHIWPRGQKLPRLFGRISVHFGNPVDYSIIRHEDKGEEVYQEIANSLRNNILSIKKSNILS